MKTDMYATKDYQSMTIRDYIAIEAMKSYISLIGLDSSKTVAAKAYRMADIMIEEMQIA